MIDDLISRRSLYEKMREAEDLARQRVIDTSPSFPSGALNPAYVHYLAQVNERTRFREMIYDEPSAQPQYKPVTAEDFAKIMSENTLYNFMAWHGVALELMERQGFVICKKMM